MSDNTFAKYVNNIFVSLGKEEKKYSGISVNDLRHSFVNKISSTKMSLKDRKAICQKMSHDITTSFAYVKED